MRSVKRGKGNYSKSHWEEKRHEGRQGKICDDSLIVIIVIIIIIIIISY